MTLPIITKGFVTFSHEPILGLTEYDPHGIACAPARFWLPTRLHQEILQRQREKQTEVLTFLVDGEVYSSMRVLSWLLKLEVRQAQTTLSGMTAQKLLVAEDLAPGTRIYGISREGAAFISPAEAFRIFCSGKTSPLTLNHRLLCQLIRIELTEFFHAEFWVAEKILIKERKFPNIPDGVFYIDDLTFAIEVELTLKTAQDQAKVLAVYCEMLCEVPDPGAWVNRVIFFTPHVDAMVERINKSVPDRLRHCFYVQHLVPGIVPYRSGTYFLNPNLFMFINTRLYRA